MSRDSWIGSIELADIAGITRQVANRTCRHALENGAVWRGVNLVVRTKRGSKGGRSGVRYEVAVSSLPADLKERLKGFREQLQGELNFDMPLGGMGKEIDWWERTLLPALQCEPGTKERREALERIASTTLTDWRGDAVTYSTRHLRVRLNQLERGEVMLLRRKRRSDKHKKRVIVTRAWDAAVPFDDATKQEVADIVIGGLRGCIKEGIKISRALPRVSQLLKVETLKRGFSPDAQVLEQICKIPPWRYHEEAPAMKRVYEWNHDRKKATDKLPSVRRRRPEFPGHCYVFDVHHINVLVEEGGKVGTVKMLGMHDWATGRFCAEFIFFMGRGGVRNFDNIEMVRARFADPDWGVCHYAYFDNGAEYNFAEYLDDALKLTARAAGWEERDTHILRARPYNARAKTIENVFSQLNQHHFRHLQGFIGDDRFNPMRPALGRMPKPFRGFDAFVTEARQAIEEYNNVPFASGELAGLSPNQAFQRHRDAGWRAVTMDVHNFDGIFCERASRKVTGHTFREGSRLWTCHELERYLGSEVVVCIPAYHGYNELRVELPDGQYLGMAFPDELRNWNDPRGAIASDERRRRTVDAIKSADQATPSAPPKVASQTAGRISFDANGPSGSTIVPLSKGRKGADTAPVEQAEPRLATLALLWPNSGGVGND